MPGTGGTEYWGSAYSYDPWGNLTQKSATKCGAEHLNVTVLANNQLSGYGYDAAGNMTHDSTTGDNYAYDAENRITGAGGYTYTYDADGNRVEKSNGSTGTIYWCMSPGIVAESDLSGNLKSEYVFFDGERVARKDYPGNALSYYFSDHLKTASVITDSAGNIKEDEDYYPWGGELQFVNNDSNHYKFTGKERDTETGLDYFGARYYGNWYGRFLSADWAAKATAVPYANFGNPQSLNLYSYTKNNPTTLGDPDGHFTQQNDQNKQAQQQQQQPEYHTMWYYMFHPNTSGATGEKAKCDDACFNSWMAFHEMTSLAGGVYAATAVGSSSEPTPAAEGTATNRLPQDASVNPNPPAANNGNGTVGPNANQNAAAQTDVTAAKAGGATDIRMNQHQVNAKGERVGINRPDLQYTNKNGVRHYVEYEKSTDGRGASHTQRTTANDPKGKTQTKVVQ